MENNVYFDRATELFHMMKSQSYLINMINEINKDLKIDNDNLHGFKKWLDETDPKSGNGNRITDIRYYKNIPSREYLIKLSFFFHFNMTQCNQLLSFFGARQLVIRHIDDAVICYYLNHPDLKFNPSILKVDKKYKIVHDKYKAKCTVIKTENDKTHVITATSQITTFKMMNDFEKLELTSTDLETIRSDINSWLNNYSNCQGLFNNSARRIIIDALNMQLNNNNSKLSQSYSVNKILSLHIETLTQVFENTKISRNTVTYYLNANKEIPRVLFLYVLVMSGTLQNLEQHYIKNSSSEISEVERINKLLIRCNYSPISMESIEDMLLMHYFINCNNISLAIEYDKSFIKIVYSYLFQVGLLKSTDELILSGDNIKIVKKMFPGFLSLTSLKGRR